MTKTRIKTAVYSEGPQCSRTDEASPLSKPTTRITCLQESMLFVDLSAIAIVSYPRDNRLRGRHNYQFATSTVAPRSTAPLPLPASWSRKSANHSIRQSAVLRDTTSDKVLAPHPQENPAQRKYRDPYDKLLKYLICAAKSRISFRGRKNLAGKNADPSTLRQEQDEDQRLPSARRRFAFYKSIFASCRAAGRTRTNTVARPGSARPLAINTIQGRNATPDPN